jgi:hypothetical protein
MDNSGVWVAKGGLLLKGSSIAPLQEEIGRGGLLLEGSGLVAAAADERGGLFVRGTGIVP